MHSFFKRVVLILQMSVCVGVDVHVIKCMCKCMSVINKHASSFHYKNHKQAIIVAVDVHSGNSVIY